MKFHFGSCRMHNFFLHLFCAFLWKWYEVSWIFAETVHLCDQSVSTFSSLTAFHLEFSFWKKLYRLLKMISCALLHHKWFADRALSSHANSTSRILLLELFTLWWAYMVIYELCGSERGHGHEKNEWMNVAHVWLYIFICVSLIQLIAYSL